MCQAKTRARRTNTWTTLETGPQLWPSQTVKMRMMSLRRCFRRISQPSISITLTAMSNMDSPFCLKQDPKDNLEPQHDNRNTSEKSLLWRTFRDRQVYSRGSLLLRTNASSNKRSCHSFQTWHWIDQATQSTRSRRCQTLTLMMIVGLAQNEAPSAWPWKVPQRHHLSRILRSGHHTRRLPISTFWGLPPSLARWWIRVRGRSWWTTGRRIWARTAPI